MKKIFVRKPSGGGWLISIDGDERACCDLEIDEYLKKQILSLFDKKGVNEIMITIETIKDIKIGEEKPVEL